MMQGAESRERGAGSMVRGAWSRERGAGSPLRKYTHKSKYYGTVPVYGFRYLEGIYCARG